MIHIYFTGIDLDSTMTKAVIIDRDEKICASGSGCFVEVIANVLQVKLEDIGPFSLYAKNPVTFTTGCAVFGESEAISRVAEGVPKEDILAGVHHIAQGVKNLEIMKSFYKDILGFNILEPPAAPHDIMSGIMRGVTPEFTVCMLSLKLRHSYPALQGTELVTNFSHQPEV